MSGPATLQPPERDEAIRPTEDPPDIAPPDDDNFGDDDSSGEPIRWVTVATFWQPAQAHVARLKLESEDIPCIISDENLVSVYWLYANAIGGVKLQVPEGDVDRARIALGDYGTPADPEFDRPRDVPPLRTCPHCGSEEVSSGAKLPRLFFGGFLGLSFVGAIALLGAVALAPLILLWFPFIWLTRGWKCDTCGYMWNRWGGTPPAPGFPVAEKSPNTRSDSEDEASKSTD